MSETQKQRVLGSGLMEIVGSVLEEHRGRCLDNERERMLISASLALTLMATFRIELDIRGGDSDSCGF